VGISRVFSVKNDRKKILWDGGLRLRFALKEFRDYSCSGQGPVEDQKLGGTNPVLLTKKEGPGHSKERVIFVVWTTWGSKGNWFGT